MKKKYILDEQSQFVGYDLVDDNYIAKNNLETCVPMPDGLYEPRVFDFSKQTWSGATREEWEANQPEPDPTPEPSEPSKEWQAINMLALQVAQLKAEKGGV